MKARYLIHAVAQNVLAEFKELARTVMIGKHNEISAPAQDGARQRGRISCLYLSAACSKQESDLVFQETRGEKPQPA